MTWSPADSKSVTCSNVSCLCTRTTGLDDFFDVDFAGSDRLRPQSPRTSDDFGVTMAARVGYGWVAVSDSKIGFELAGVTGGDRACGSANTLDFRSRFAVGDNLAEDMASTGIEVSQGEMDGLLGIVEKVGSGAKNTASGSTIGAVSSVNTLLPSSTVVYSC